MCVCVQGRQISTGDLEEMGRCFCQALDQLKGALSEQEVSREQEGGEGGKGGAKMRGKGEVNDLQSSCTSRLVNALPLQYRCTCIM